MKPLEALVKIKILLQNFYANIGREMLEDINETRRELLDKIDELIEKVNIPRKLMVIEGLKDEDIQDN